jgi:rod shape-determining protein MreC
VSSGGSYKLRLVEDRDRRLKIILNVIVLTIAFFSMARRSPVISEASLAEKTLIDFLAPIQRGVTSAHSHISYFFDDYLNNISASKENKVLEKKVSEYEKRVFRYQETLKENERLKKLLKFGSSISYEKVLARVVAWDASSDIKVVRINKGANDGLQIQSPVVTSAGLVGYVYRMTDHFADVLTILDSNNKVDALLQRVRAHGIVEGDNIDGAIIKYISRSEPIVLGDIMITSGLGNIYPKGIRIGYVSRIEREIYGITQGVEVTPAVDFGRLEEVIILILEGNDKKQLEWTALDKAESVKQEGSR